MEIVGLSGSGTQPTREEKKRGREGGRWVRKTGVRNVGLCGQGGKGERLIQGEKV